jgi:hypothetical protein
MFLTIFLLTLILTGIALIGLGVQTFFSKKKAFPETRVGHNKTMRKKKIYCVKTQQAVIDKNYKQKSWNQTTCSGC